MMYGAVSATYELKTCEVLEWRLSERVDSQEAGTWWNRHQACAMYLRPEVEVQVEGESHSNWAYKHRGGISWELQPLDFPCNEDDMPWTKFWQPWNCANYQDVPIEGNRSHAEAYLHSFHVGDRIPCWQDEDDADRVKLSDDAARCPYHRWFRNRMILMVIVTSPCWGMCLFILGAMAKKQLDERTAKGGSRELEMPQYGPQ